MALWLYRLVFLPVMLVAAPYYLWRMRRRGGYAAGFGQRFGAVSPGLPPSQAGCRRIWLQAVSVGELLAVGPLIEALLADGTAEIYLTTTTSTGYRLAREKYADRLVGVGYFPLDFWGCSARAWARVRPDLALLTEGERWPEHVHQARRRGVPVIVINARLSDRSYRRMRAVRALVPALLGGITRLLAVAEEDARRLREIGFAGDRVVVTGNLKVDQAIPEIDAAARARLRGELGFGADDLILLGSSTWPGEEAALAAAWQLARRTTGLGPRLKLLLVPRHAERRAEVEAVVTAQAGAHHLRSRGVAPGPMDITIADTTGELQRLTQVATLVFVGKSLPPHTEGQTPVEAAGLGRPLLFGPGMSNFKSIARDLCAGGAAETVTDAGTLAGAVERLLGDERRRQAMAAAGRRWHEANRGALARTVAVVRGTISGPPTAS